MVNTELYCKGNSLKHVILMPYNFLFMLIYLKFSFMLNHLLSLAVF